MYSKTQTMNRVVSNIMYEINETNKEKFTKNEIMEILNKYTEKEALPNLEFEGFVVNPINYSIEGNGINHRFVKKEFQLLYLLLSNKNKIHTRQEILSKIWGDDIVVVDRTIDVHICKIKRVLNEYNRIVSRKGIGYIWEDEK